MSFLGSELRKFTLAQLKQNDGKNGRSAFIVHRGNVYDVTNSDLWGNGDHFSMHQAGQDVTDALSDAPHGDDKLEAAKLIGELIK